MDARAGAPGADAVTLEVSAGTAARFGPRTIVLLSPEVAAAANVEVRSERILPTADRDGLQEVPIEITVAGGIRESMNVLDQLERTSKLLTMQDLKVRVISAGQPRDLLTTITVAGYLLTTPPTAKPGDKPAAPPGPAPAPGRRG